MPIVDGDRQGMMGEPGHRAGMGRHMGILLEGLGGLLLVALIVRGIFGFIDDLKRRRDKE